MAIRKATSRRTSYAIIIGAGRNWFQKADREVPTHRRHEGAPYSPRPTVHPMMNAVGGTTIHYWAQSWRLNPWDFKGQKRHRLRAMALRFGRIGRPWKIGPSGLEELEPYYDKVEYEVGIFQLGRQRHGQVG